MKASPLINFNWVYFDKLAPIPPETKKTIVSFVGNVLKLFIKRNGALVDEEEKKKMLTAFKKRPIADNEMCFGAGKQPSPKASWWKHTLFFPLVALGLAIVIIIFKIESCSSDSGDKKAQPANAKGGKNK